MHLTLTLSPIVASALLVSCHVIDYQVRDNQTHAVYTLDNDPAGASIVSLHIDQFTGIVSSPVKTSTGGKGLVGATGSNSVVVSGDYLFTVSPGSNTISMFSIDNKDPWQPSLVGQPANTLGQFPMSVAYSSKIKTACVLNGGPINGVTCFSTDHQEGLAVLDIEPRSMSPQLNQTTPPPVGASFTAQDLFFNPSSTALFAIVLGSNNTDPSVPATFFAWPVVEGKVSTTPVVSVIRTLRAVFSGQFVNDDTMIVTDFSFGAALVQVSSSLQIMEKEKTVIPAQLAACWTAYSPRFDSIYVSDAFTTNITVLDPASGAIKTQVPFDPSLGGADDSAIDRNWLYVLALGASAGANVVVIDLQGSNSGKVPTSIQTFYLGDIQVASQSLGMAVYPS
ncbi:hypothetical protein MMC13_003194 [Lambiella insularis]|nr:hypothetical protein [Lambiella insularis]